jgi:hypothetical protein
LSLFYLLDRIIFLIFASRHIIKSNI